MNICMVGGIFGKSLSYRELVPSTPETILTEGLRARGHTVFTASHLDTVDYFGFDVTHIHHLGLGAVRAALDRSSSRLIITLHNEPAGLTHRMAAEFVLRRADAVVDLAPDLAMRRAALAHRQGTLHKVIPNGVPTRHFDVRERTPPRQDELFRLLYVGQLIPMKRVDVLLRAVATLTQRRRIHLDLVYHIATEEERLRRLCHELSIDRCVTFRGAVKQTELGESYRRAHTVVLPSEGDYLPGVLTESMMCGTPVVATSAGAMREQVSRFGVIVEPSSVPALVVGLDEMITDYSRFCSLSREMAATARARYSVDSVLTQHEELYTAVLAGAGPQRNRPSNMRSAPLRVALRLESLRRTGLNRFRQLRRGQEIEPDV
jgi:glycosyltransferase involved in cell wall biosynthesis